MIRTVLISGAAEGMAKAASELFLKDGYNVAAFDYKQDSLEQCVKEFDVGDRYLPIVGDARSLEDIERAVKMTMDKYGRIDTLINNAGGAAGAEPGSPTPDLMKTETWDAVMELNLYTMFNFTKAVLPIMKEQKYGRIVNTSSIAGRGRSIHGNIAYATAKAAVQGFCRHASLDLGVYGITINAMAPSLVMVDRVQKYFDANPPEYKAQVRASVVVNRLGVPMDGGRALHFLGTEDAGFITGAIIDVNGGMWVG